MLAAKVRPHNGGVYGASAQGPSIQRRYVHCFAAKVRPHNGGVYGASA